MNNPLNKSIFSETGCISRQLLLSYRDGMLSRSDMHEVEKHLVDCDLCSEALEGLELISNTMVLDEISQHLLGSDTIKPSSKNKPMRYWAMAASLTAVVALSYFAIQQSQKAQTIDQALNEPQTELTETMMSPVSSPTPSTVQSGSPITTSPAEISSESKSMQQPRQAVKQSMDHASEQKDAVLAETAAIDIVKSYNSAEEEDLGSSKNLEVIEQANAGATAAAMDELSDSQIKSVEQVVLAKQKSSKGTRTPGATAPSAANNSNVYQAEVIGKVESLDERAVKSPSTPLELYQNRRYAEALNGFDQLILQKNNNESDVFYKGMCLYHLKRFKEAAPVLSETGKNRSQSFSDEALYHAALSYEKIGDMTSAIELLETLAQGSGSYKQKAAKRLKQLSR